MSEPKVIVLHDNQKKALLSKARVICCVAGKQGGKSTVAMLWARMKSSNDFEPGDNAIVAAPTFKIFSQSTLPKFQEYFNGIGKWNKGEMSFQVNGRGKIFLRSMHEPDSAEGITSVKWIVADEAGKLKLRAYQNLVARSAFKESQVFLATTPYSMNWLYKDIYKPWVKGR